MRRRPQESVVLQIISAGNRIEIMFGRLKDWRRVATRYDRSPKVFLSAIALAATVIFWL
ncbi:transposase [Palleronia sp.]|uniref:transposase n=1 Tax=Palleronia sp. TaxID=1940284 RepID=UPI0035C7CBFC